MENEPERPMVIQKQSSIFDMPTGAMRSSPEVVVLELMRNLFFKRPKEKNTQLLEPGQEGFSLNEDLAIRSFQGRQKNLNRVNSKPEHYYSPAYPWLARESYFRKKDPDLINGFLLKGPLAHHLKSSFQNKSGQEKIISGFSELLINALLGESDKDNELERGEIIAACVGIHNFNKTEKIKELKEKLLRYVDNTQILPYDEKRPSNLSTAFTDLEYLLKAENKLPRQHWIAMLTCYLRLTIPLWCLCQFKSTIFLRDWILDSLSGNTPTQDEIENKFKTRSQALLCPSETWGPFIEEHLISYMKARIQVSCILDNMGGNKFLPKIYVNGNKPIKVSVLDKCDGLDLLVFLSKIESFRSEYATYIKQKYKLPHSPDLFQRFSHRLSEKYTAWNDKTKGQQKNLNELMHMFRTSDARDERGSHLIEASKKSDSEVRVLPGQMVVQVFTFFADNARRLNKKRGVLVLNDLINHFKGYGIDYEDKPDGIKILINQISGLGILAGSPDAGKSAKIVNPYRDVTRHLFP